MAMFFKIWLNEEQLLWRDFNQRPPDKRTGALPTELSVPMLAATNSTHTQTKASMTTQLSS